MFYILIPIILILIFIFKKANTTEKFSNFWEPKIFPSDRNYRSDHITKVKAKDYTIEILQLNPFFEKEIYSFETEDGLKENLNWDEDFLQRLCVGCACTNPKKYCVKGNTDLNVHFTPSSSINPGMSPSDIYSPIESNSPNPSPTDEFIESNFPNSSPGPSPSFSEAFQNMNPTPSDGPSYSPSDGPSYSPSYSPSYNEPEACEDGYEEKELSLCSFTNDNKMYQCSQTCPECNLCHKENNRTAGRYKDFCGKEKMATDKELCNFFSTRVKHVKDKCVFPYRVNNVKLNDKECYSFKLRNDNRFIKNDIVIVRIKSHKYADKIKINKIFYKSGDLVKRIRPIEFFTDTKEHYFFFNTNNLNDFNNDVIINFDFSLGDKKYSDSLKINIRKLLEYIPRYDENLGHKKEKEPCTVGATFDDYELNYLEESEPKTSKLVNGYSVKNKVKEYGLGEFKKYDFKDEPDTWRLRADINRPWISVG
jgi:hypothetical protein